MSVTLGQDGYQRLLSAGSMSVGPGNLLGAIEVGHNNGPWDVPENARRLNGVLRWSMTSGADIFAVTGMTYAARQR